MRSNIKSAEKFYDDFAQNYHHMFQDWEATIANQAILFNGIIERFWGKEKVDVLDCTCGIGTQSIGLAQMGHRVVGTDISKKAIERAKQETTKRGLVVDYRKMNLLFLGKLRHDFHAVMSIDNSLPNLIDDDDLLKALKEIKARLKLGGIFVATIRDYDELIKTKPQMMPPMFHREPGKESISFQVWNWIADNLYELHQHTSLKKDDKWVSFHEVKPYRALRRDELSASLEQAGFDHIEWQMPKERGVFQPLVIASANAPSLG
ncbi:MAG: class I SAM-dependent methyltransferase [Alphaproteobacteria bacterium]